MMSGVMISSREANTGLWLLQATTRERVRESSLATNLVFSRVCEEFDNQI